jgi:hypothetical protein
MFTSADICVAVKNALLRLISKLTTRKEAAHLSMSDLLEK